MFGYLESDPRTTKDNYIVKLVRGNRVECLVIWRVTRVLLMTII